MDDADGGAVVATVALLVHIHTPAGGVVVPVFTVEPEGRCKSIWECVLLSNVAVFYCVHDLSVLPTLKTVRNRVKDDFL